MSKQESEQPQCYVHRCVFDTLHTCVAMFLGREDVVRQGEGSDRSLTLPGMAPHHSAPLSEAVMEKIPMSRTPRMEQYDGVSHPQNQSLLVPDFVTVTRRYHHAQPRGAAFPDAIE